MNADIFRKTAMKPAVLFCAACFAVLPLLADTSPSGIAKKNSDKKDHAILRLLNSRASGSPEGYAEAAKVVAEDAAQGKPLQQFIIALVSRDANAPAAARISESKRREYLSRSRKRIRALAEKRGNALAWYLLSMEKNDLKLLKRAAEGGNVQAMNAWGTIQLTEALANPGSNPDEAMRIQQRCFSMFKRAADMKDPNGYYNLGMCYMNGYGVEKDADMAYDCFKFASEAQHPEAMNNVGAFFRDGMVVEKDLATAARWFKRSADFGNSYGQLNYGLALQRGEGVAADSAAAVKLFKASAEQGNAAAMDAYGMCLYKGDGVPKNEFSAVGWYRRSAALGCAEAMENLAFCSAMGVGGMKPDQNEATVWKIRARAARGDGNAVAWLKQNGHSLR